MAFANRSEGGRVLAARLRAYARRSDVVVLALAPRAVPVAFEIALELGGALDIFRDPRDPVAPERPSFPGTLGSGSAAPSGGRGFDRAGRVELRDKVVILVDDGLTAPAALLSAARAVRRRPILRLVVASPVAVRRSTAQLVPPLVDDLVVGVAMDSNRDLSFAYREPAGPSDDEVRMLLDRARHGATAERDKLIPLSNNRALRTTLAVPAHPRGVVVVARGPTARAQSARAVAAELRDAGFATFVVDLLTDDERRAHAAGVRRSATDHVARSARRLDVSLQAALQTRELWGLPAALCFLGEDHAQSVLAAARFVQLLRAVLVAGPRALHVSRGAPLAPTLIVAPAQPGHVLPRGSGVAVVLVPGNGATTDEPVPLFRVTSLARDWFTAHIAAHEAWATM